ncbi:hypothetical protein Bbelb_359500 [Branchiostoma belcheri]|nr:hypothetical protein Bbelb_359500 [Branchiostoma belcheri]
MDEDPVESHAGVLGSRGLSGSAGGSRVESRPDRPRFFGSRGTNASYSDGASAVSSGSSAVRVGVETDIVRDTIRIPVEEDDDQTEPPSEHPRRHHHGTSSASFRGGRHGAEEELEAPMLRDETSSEDAETSPADPDTVISGILDTWRNNDDDYYDY